MLGLTPAFDLDARELEQRYRDLQRALHPDRFAQASASERRASLSRAVSVNDAYRALRDELKRGELLLQRYGGSHDAKGDPALLMEVMELREALADSKSARDAAARERLTRDVEQKRQASTEALREALRSLAAAPADRAGPLAEAARALSRLRYYRRFLDEVALHEEDEQAQ